MVDEAKLADGVPQTDGWFVVNAKDARWSHNELGAYCPFEGEGDLRFGDVGINISVLPPGAPMAMYHEEPGQEDFLVMSGEALLIVEGRERPLRQWDFVHCPPRTKHVIVGAGTEPAVVIAVGARKGGATYSVDEAAVRHNAGVDHEVSGPAEAYAGYSRPEPGPPPRLP